MMVNAFIPTMPHDDGPEVMQATTGKWYECPQGHRYVITECGRPNQNYNCPTCHSPIGGMNYGLAANNRDASREDRTSTGHILGRAQPQRGTVESERNMNPLSCGVLRCLTHLAMLLGTDQDIQRIAATVKPAVGDVVQFLKEHIKNDIRCIARNTGHNDVEAEQIIHLVLVGIMNNTDQQRGLNFDIRLATKESRAAWEDAFLNTYLNPVLSNISNLLQESLGRMVRDERLGNNRLMKLIYEHDDPKETVATELTPMCPALWRHRKKITIEYLSFKFQEYSQDGNKLERCEVLAEFLKKEQHLRALQYLPDIVKLQRLLFEKFHRRLDRIEAETYIIGKFLKSVSQVKEQFISLIDSFRKAWKIVRTALVQDGPFSISQEMCSFEVTNSTVISMFLPARSGVGRCALALNNFLVTLHNDFIGRCKSLLKDESRLPDMSLKSVTKAHLVAYDPEKDFIPIILAHCDYSLNLGEETVLEFNWKSLERQIVDRFIRGRPRLTSLVELFVFSKDICDGEVFKALQQKIPQVELTRPVQDQILNELNQLTDVCDVLKSLHIAIGFLSSAGGDPSMSVFDYLHSGLKMEVKNGLKSRKAEQFCELQHIVSLWLLLSLERARILTKHKQDPFDDVTDTVKVSLETKQKFALNGGLQKLNVDRFVLVLLEFILLYLKNVPDDQLHFPLSQYMNAKLDELNREVIDALEEYIPEDITVEHAVEAWKIACRKSEDYHLRLEQ
ncbi:E3 ubiquitin-protein ligase RNF213-like [Dendronephthya gigantea]|uniref:E3 ubiquitin-protein ligase RNF213-like n=1 Tax=Dendronephthya gigantea TaxID=151771 RepID=UPI00106BC94D|nr:E3 ubiquitin-protein ligase RNF213-like [Dendronephthya gigantea]